MPAIDRAEAKRYLSNFDFTGFFSELLGWNRPPRSVPLVKQVGLQSFSFTLVAEKKGYAVLLCESIPSYQDRAKLDRLIARDYFEHMLIFLDRPSKKQLWQVSLREKGRGVRLREVHLSASGEELLQKLEHIIVPLEKEETTHLTDIHAGVTAAFDVEKVTKRFFNQFELEHESFAKFLKGIPASTKPWYVSVLINRLMFLYFMQAKRFLNDDPHYLTTKLAESKASARDSFYSDFLCPLFFQGFALRESERPAAIKKLLGDIPYLNGGLFQRHPLEMEHGDSIVIPDSVFEKLFAFFGKWTWHLDQRTSADGDEIDPDVLGYIFEKYINQKQMGAYYTKEDITGYIAQNTVLPFLFDGARKDCANAFKPDGVVWRLLIERPDRYIYEALRRGNETTARAQRLTLPSEITAGLEDVTQRSGWNRTMPSELERSALPAETWREFLARRRRYDELRAHIERGEIHEVNEVVTFNLDIRQLALDVIQYAGSEDLVESFYKAIETVTILDPTCGSGAFLFAALELLQPLYDACLERMDEFVREAESNATLTGVKLHFNRFAHFRKTLAASAKHVNREYFVLKTIIVNNLYGVDIMDEATEICKLRLFLKLVAQIESKRKDRIEPLPDIDFNIRSGNTLVGYARYEDVKNAAGAKLAFDDPMARINDRLNTLDQAMRQFRLQQTEFGGAVSSEDKASLRRQFSDLEAELDDFLAAECGIKNAALPKWKADTKPFHWFCDFHPTLSRGGFDIIVGNPPYVEYAKIRKSYSVSGYSTLVSGNLFAMVVERCGGLLLKGGRMGLIIPLSAVCTERMSPLREIAFHGTTWLSNFDMRPSSLFEGVAQRLTILIQQPDTKESRVLSGGYRRWASPERSALLDSGGLVEVQTSSSSSVAKLSSSTETSILRKLSGPQLEFQVRRDAEPIYVHRIIRYFVKALDEVPTFVGTDGKSGRSPDYKPFCFEPALRQQVTALLNSSLFYWYWRTFSDGFHCGYGDVYRMPFSPSLDESTALSLAELNGQLQLDLRRNSTLKKIKTKAGSITYREFYPKESKRIIDQIDFVLARHYGLTEVELDFIINYDIKYRMGADSGDAEVDE